MAKTTLVHPTFDDVFVQVTDAKSWREAGWKTSSAKAAAEAGVELRPVDDSNPASATDAAE